MNTKQAISELKQFLSLKKASDHAEALLEKLAFVEQETKEAEAERDKFRQENAALESSVKGNKEKIQAAEDQAASIISAAEAKAAEIVASAVSDANKEKEKASDELSLINERIKDANKVEKESIEAAEKAKTKLFEINAELEDAKDKLKKFVG